MQALSGFLFLLAASFAFSNAAKYAGRFDNIDLDEVLRSDRLLKNYFECLMERGPCTAEGSELRKTIPDALQTDCTKCSEVQKSKAAKAINYLQDNKPDMYKELQQKYDPEGHYKKRIRENLHLNKTSQEVVVNSGAGITENRQLHAIWMRFGTPDGVNIVKRQ